MKISFRRSNPYIWIGKLNTFLLIKDSRYGTGLVVEWWGDKGTKVRTFPSRLFAVDDL